MNHQEFKNKLLQDKKLKQIYENPDVFFSISHSIFEMRVKHSLTQSALANLVGMQQEAIARLENPGYSVKYLISLQKIARVLVTSLIPPKLKELADKEEKRTAKIKILFASSAGNFDNLNKIKTAENSSSLNFNY